MKQGAFDYLTKPLERDDLLRIVARAFDRIGLIQENRLLRQQLEERYRIEGSSEATTGCRRFSTSCTRFRVRAPRS